MNIFARAALLADSQPAAGWEFPLPIWVVVLGVLFVLYVISRRRSLRSRMAAKLQSVGEQLQELNGLAADLTMHMFLEDGWENALTGKSQATLAEARTLKSQAFAALEAVKQRHAEAAKAGARRKSWYSRERALQNTYRLLSVEPLEIDGVSWLPGKLMEALKSWFADVTAKLDTLAAALRECRLARAELDKELTAVAEKFASLQSAGFQWTDFDTRCQELARSRKLLADPVSDPLDATGQIAGLRQRAGRMQLELEEMVARQSTFEAEVSKQMSAIAKVIEGAQDTKIDYGFPLTGEQTQPWLSQSLPVEQIVAVQTSANGAVTRARAALLRGDVAGFGKELAHFRRIAGATLEQYDGGVEAKDKVDQLAAVLWRSLDQLAQRLATAGGVVQRMESEFHPSDFAEAQSRVCEAAAVGDRAESEWLEIKDHYDALRFSEALESGERLAEAVAKAESRLKGLERFRDEIRQSRDAVLAMLQKHRSAYDSLQKKLELHGHAVWDKTARSIGELEELYEEAGGEKPAWKSLESRCEQLSRQLKQLCAAVDEEKRAYDKAVEKLEAARDAAREAGRSAARASTRRVGRTKLEEATRLLEILERDMQVAGSDWSELSKHAEEVVRLAREATSRGNTDETKYQEAVAAIASAQAKQDRLGDYATGHKATGKMEAAVQTLSEARVALEDRRWEDAAKLAWQAEQSFQGSINARGL